MEDNNPNTKIYNFIRASIFGVVLLDIYIQCIAFRFNGNPLVERLNHALYQFPLLVNVRYSHAVIFISVMIVAGFGAQAVKDVDFNFKKQFAYLFTVGLLLFLLSIPAIDVEDNNVRLGLYSLTYFAGAILLFMAFANLSKYIWTTLKKDIWNA
ncbi:MAG: YWFCY domain-containing protein, partial [Chitinophagaceae bacterium]|nr:YWFCY domain-containing protein [Chitinophagaceae bacterium]